ncbi:hypothetical protein SAMN05216227_103617 [Pseudorhodobacter antarcticus]|uniref:Uncharacterized protein n=1 Tax=Pseudorhodobacter antarcticus TaxID=1077947 RepID=A0A1H8KXC1_9RHOB|nr:hypothetical protein [Pseudorhodobacter antarcticus]SEN97544.1 hypothetical protein SAMN05216227_103617 [Pseudorhodobacter antarcticus]
MTADFKRVEKLTVVLKRLRDGENVQNRQLRTLLGVDGYARFVDDWRVQQEIRKDLKNKPDIIVEYEKHLKQAVFTYSKAESASRRGRKVTAKKLFAAADTQFERLVEFLSDHIKGDGTLEMWFDRSVHFDANNSPSSSADDFPCVVTSRSLRNIGGSFLAVKRTINEVKIDVVEQEIYRLTHDQVDELALLAARKIALRML